MRPVQDPRVHGSRVPPNSLHPFMFWANLSDLRDVLTLLLQLEPAQPLPLLLPRSHHTFGNLFSDIFNADLLVGFFFFIPETSPETGSGLGGLGREPRDQDPGEAAVRRGRLQRDIRNVDGGQGREQPASCQGIYGEP